MLARECEIVAVDFESTGIVGSYADEPWQVGMVKLRNGTVDASSCYSTLLNIKDRPFSPYAPGTHHEVRESLSEAPDLKALWPMLRPWWTGSPLAAHNASTEIRFMRKAAPLHKVGPWIDTLKLSRYIYPSLQSHKLSAVLDSLSLTPRVAAVCPGLAPHDALYDAVGSAAILEHLLGLEDWKNVTLEGLVSIPGAKRHRPA